MGECIEREAALREFDSNGSRFVFGLRTCRAIQSRLRMIPAADVQPLVRAKWIPHNNPMFSPFDDTEEHLYQCSACFAFRPHKENFCPDCGAKMEEA